VDKVGQGKVFTGSQALGAHLVDEMGGMRQALDWARAAAHLSEEAAVVELPVVEGSLVGRLLGLEGMKADGQVLTLLPAVAAMARQVGPMLVYDGDQPLARLEWTSELP
jgi:ClpP class serine protease